MRLRDLHGPHISRADFETSHLLWRLRLSHILLRASALLTRLAVRLSLSRKKAPPALEFYAEAGAPEGALYADGHLVGTLPGIQRL